MTAETLKEQVVQAFPDHADAIIGSYRQLYPNANPFQLLVSDCDIRYAGQHCGTGRAQGCAEWRAGVLLPVRLANAGAGCKADGFHCSELAFVFNNTDRCERMTGGGDAARVLGAAMSDAWVQFARTGDPNVKSLPHWKPFTPEARTTMIFNDVSVAKDKFDDAQLELTKRWRDCCTIAALCILARQSTKTNFSSTKIK